MSIPVLTLLIAIPMIGAIAVSTVVDPMRARRVAIASAGLSLLVALILLVAIYYGIGLGAADGRITELAVDLGPLGAQPLLATDGLSTPLLALAAILAIAVLAAAPRIFLDRSSMVAVLAITAATFGLLLSRNLALLTGFWIGTLVPGLWRIAHMTDPALRPRLLRTYSILLVGCALPFAVGAWILGSQGIRADAAAPLDLGELAAIGIPVSKQNILFALFMITIAARMALVPFHSWLPIFAKRGPIGVTMLLIGVQTGLYLIFRLVIPLFPHACVSGMQVIAALALVSAVSGSIMALAQNDLRRMIGFLTVSQGGFVMIGVSALNQESMSGALLQSIGMGLATSALFLLIRSIEARTGTADMRHLGGLVARAPRAAAIFFLFGVAAVGFPGSVGFVGEDLLLHGVLHHNPLVAGLMLLATALNGITVFRAYCRTFLGRAAHRPRTAGPLPIDDLLPRERYVACALAVLIFGGGILPQPLLNQRHATVQEVVQVIRSAEIKPPSPTRLVPAQSE